MNLEVLIGLPLPRFLPNLLPITNLFYFIYLLDANSFLSKFSVPKMGWARGNHWKQGSGGLNVGFFNLKRKPTKSTQSVDRRVFQSITVSNVDCWPTGQPTGQPSAKPTGQPTGKATTKPTGQLFSFVSFVMGDKKSEDCIQVVRWRIWPKLPGRAVSPYFYRDFAVKLCVPAMCILPNMMSSFYN